MLICWQTRLKRIATRQNLNTVKFEDVVARAASSDPRLRTLTTQLLAIGSDSQVVKAGRTEKTPRVPRTSVRPFKIFLKKRHSVLEPRKAKETRSFHTATAKVYFQAPAESFSRITELNMAPSTSDTTGEKSTSGGHDKPLVVGRTKPTEEPSKDTVQALNSSIEQNIQANTKTSAPSEPTTATTPSQPPTQKKEKAPKPSKPSKAPATPTAPLSPALLDLRVGHILRCIAHPNADSLFVSTIAMGDEEGTEYTQVDEETGKVVRTVCSGLNGLVPLAEMQDRKVVVVANLKPVNMRSIKSAAMVLAASPKAEEGADPHAADRVVELVQVPEAAEAGDKVYFEGWPYGEGKGPEKQLNPKKKQWEAIQPGFYTSEDLVVGFDAVAAEGVDGRKGDLVVEGKGKCFVKTLKGAVVR
jgi:tRNA-binding EMAP/Myf-like protein